MKDYYFIMNAGVKAGGEITHAVLEGKIVSAPKGYDAFTGIEAARGETGLREYPSADGRIRHRT